MNGLYHAHSGLRFLVLLAGFFAVIALAMGLLQKKPFGKLERVASSAFVGLLDTQILLGVVLVAIGLFSPRLIGHIVMMVAAAALAHVMSVLNRKKPTPGHLWPLIGVAGALLLIVGGIFAIGRLPWASTAFGGP